MNKKDMPLDTDKQKAAFRKTLTFFRSKWVVGTSEKLDDAFDDAIQSCVNELSGENMCHMSVQQVTITPIVLPHIPQGSPSHYQYIVTVLAQSARGYPRHIPQSREYLQLLERNER